MKEHARQKDSHRAVTSESWQLPRPFLVAGPCSAESQEQLLHTARPLAQIGVHVFRAGVWKPRTRPDSFQGVGDIGLEWLRIVKEETHMQVATEVANARHVDKALRAGIDVLWIGARTTVNPFSVQEIADALKGVDVPVMVKNPIHPDLQLWIGAIERLKKAGIERIIAVHRGFAFYGENYYRNKPKWIIPLELRQIFPGVPLICDISHISGSPKLLYEVAQHAARLQFDGLMTEVHYRPQQAKSDAYQQITPEEYRKLIERIDWLQAGDEWRIAVDLEEIRNKIDQIDRELIKVLSKRMQLVNEIGLYKKQHRIALYQPKRWAQVFRQAQQWGAKNHLPADFIARLYQLIHQESLRRQQRIMDDEEE